MKTNFENLNDDLFNLNDNEIIDSFKNEKRADNNILIVKPENGKDNVYSLILRFIPWYKNPKKSIIEKRIAGNLKDPITGEYRILDDQYSLGEKSILYDMYRKLYNSNDAISKEYAKIFKTTKSYYTLVQVIKDKYTPENEGKIFVLRFGTKTFQKIKDESSNDYGFTSGNSIFSIFNAKAFNLKVTKIGGFNNYDNSKFLDEKVGIIIDGKNVNTLTDENKKIVYEFLKNNSPDLESYSAKKWTEDDLEFVKNVIKNVNSLIKGDISDISNLSKSKDVDSFVKEDVKDEVKVSNTNDDDVDDDFKDVYDSL